MKRPIIVIGATVVGLVALLTFHTTPSRLSLGALPGASASRTTPSSTTPAGASPPTSTTTTAPSGSAAAGSPSTTTPPTTAPPTTSGTRSATGSAVNYNWGVLSVKATVSGSKLTTVTIASLDDGGNPRSQSIDQQSIPILEQQALQAQSANIQGVSGASYTSAGFAQSLQSALGQLGFK
jgi:uncharacterized protein with FMN-binding domain